MITTINSDLIRGNIDTIILKALFEGDRYGYDIIKEIEQKSNGQYKLKQPTLYSCLKRLEVQNFIRSYWGAKTSGGRRKYYTLTDMGRELFIKSQSEWEYSRTVIDKLISDKEFVLTEADYNAATAIAEEFEKEANEEPEEEIIENSLDSNSIEFIDEKEAEKYQQAAEIKEEQPEPVQNYDQDEHNNVTYIDTTQILKDLFNNTTDQNSYSDKLYNEQYVKENNSYSSQNATNYFKDFTDDYSDLLSGDDTAATKTELTQDIKTQAQSERQFQESAAEPKTSNQFISYSAPVLEAKNDDKRILEREYKGLLGKLLVNQDLNLDEIKIEKNKLPKYEEEPPKSAKIIARETALNENLSKITETARDTTGDNLKARIHDNRSDAIFRKKYHYYSNKLMLAHYGILFAIMMTAIVVTFLTAFSWLKVYKPEDLYVYILAVILTLAFPVYAAVVNFLNPEKKKRCEFDIKNNLIFKSLVSLCFLIITYCANLYLGMGFSLSIEYLSTLLLPALLSLCFPISTIIFYILYSSGKYNQK